MHQRSAFIAVWLLFVAGASAEAQTTTWKGPLGGDFNNSNNWTNGIPAPTVNAIIPTGGNSVISGPLIIGPVTINPSTAFLTLNSNANLSLDSGAQLFDYGGLSNGGTIQGSDGTGSATLALAGTNQLYTNTASGTIENLSISGGTGYTGTITDSGNILVNQGAIQGGGSLDATYGKTWSLNNSGNIGNIGFQPLTIAPGDNSINSGLMQAGVNSDTQTETGELAFLNTTFNNTGGTILATAGDPSSNVAGGFLSLGFGTVFNHGTMTIDGSATMFGSGSGILNAAVVNVDTLNGIGTLEVFGTGVLGSNVTAGKSLNIQIDTGSQLYLAGGLTNNATITFQSGAGNTDLVLNGGGTVTNNGTITLSNSVNNRISASVGGMTLLNTGTITGSGSLNTAYGFNWTLTNSGTITAIGSAGLLIAPGAGVNNTGGTLQAGDGTNSGTLILSDTITGGSIIANASSTVDLREATIQGATLSDPKLSNAPAGVIQVVGFATFGRGNTIASGSTVAIQNGGTLDLNGGLTNNGTLALNSIGFFTQLVINSGTGTTTTINGTGAVAMDDNPMNLIVSNFAGQTLQNNATISGAGVITGQLGLFAFTLNNSGTITAVGNTGLLINPGAGVNNTGGFLQAGDGVNPGTLILANDTFTGGSIVANANSTVDLREATIQGATFSNAPSGLIQVEGGHSATFGNGNTIASGTTVAIQNGGTLNLNGGLTNNGALALNSTGSLSQLVINVGAGSTLALSAPGAVTMSDNSSNLIVSNFSGQTLQNNSTISGSGKIDAARFAFALNNAGTITAIGSSGLLVAPGAGVNNTGGILQAGDGTNAGTLILSDIITGGSIIANASSTVDLRDATIQGATLSNAPTGVIQVEGGHSATFGAGNTIASGSTVSVQDGGFLLLNGALNNNGTLALNSAGNITKLGFDAGAGGTATISGAGIVNLGNSASNLIYAPSFSGQTLQNNGAIIGSGQITNQLGGFAFTLNNTDVIAAVGSAGLTIAPGAGVNNTGGILEAGIGLLAGTLTLSGNTVTGGSIVANGAGTVNLSGGVVVNGATFTSNMPSGIIQVQGGASAALGATDTISSGSTLSVQDGGTLQLNGTTLTNNGTLALNSNGSFASLWLTGGAGGTTTLNGGVVSMSNNLNNVILATGGAEQTLQNNGTIMGAGTIGDSIGSAFNLINGGTLLANQSNQLHLNLGGNLTNNGTFQTAAGSTLLVDTNTNFTNFTGQTLTGGTYTLSGTLQFANANIVHNAATIQMVGAGARIQDQNGNNGLHLVDNTALGAFDLESDFMYSSLGNFANAGMVDVFSGSLFSTGGSDYEQTGGITQVDGGLSAGLVDIEGGTLKGTGTVTGNVDVENGGVVAPGDSPGTLTVTGNYTQASTGELDIFVDGSDPGSGYSVLDVTGQAQLGGVLDFKPLDGFTPFIGETFFVIDATGGVNGQFSSIVWDDLNSVDFSLTETSDGVMITAEAASAPEPGTFWLLAGAAGLIALFRMRAARN